jgi:glycosyltransferase involved in cell wall biosynthesis
MTKIDIILPYYNGSQYIKEQLDSVLRNDLEGIDLRIIVINDASSDSETAYLKSILPVQADYYQNDNNLGVIKTVERGLGFSTAPYIMLCDQDDVWLSHKIKSTLEKMQGSEENLPCLVYTDLAIVNETLNVIHPSMHGFYRHNHSGVKPSIIFHNIVTGCSVMINRKLLDLSLPMPTVTMHDHWLALVATFTGKIIFLDNVTILYRQHGKNQVGTPNKSVFNKILNYKTTFPRFRDHLRLKTEMVETLAKRLNSKEVLFLQNVVRAIKEKDIPYLVSTKTITGSLIRIIGTSGLLLIQKFESK